MYFYKIEFEGNYFYDYPFIILSNLPRGILKYSLNSIIGVGIACFYSK